MDKEQEKWAIFWCQMLSPVIYEEIEPELTHQLLRQLADTKTRFPDGRIGKPSLSTPIWRRLIVKDNIRLDQLHSVLQVAMGWSNYHLHQYRVGRSYIGIPDQDFDMDVTDERKVYLQDIISNPKDNFVYEYDYGDGWEHKIVLEKILPLDSSESPAVIKGKKACPPEDCGGIWGYADFLDAIQDPKHEEHESMLEWVGGGFDPDEFDMNYINKKLNDLKL